MDVYPSPIGALAPVVSLAEARLTRAPTEQVKTRRQVGDDSETGQGRLLAFCRRPRTAHVRHPNRSAKRKRQIGDDEWYAAMGARIRAARIERGISEEDAARAAGRSVATWRHYERTGRGHITWPVVTFAARFGISLDALIRDPE